MSLILNALRMKRSGGEGGNPPPREQPREKSPEEIALENELREAEERERQREEDLRQMAEDLARIERGEPASGLDDGQKGERWKGRLPKRDKKPQKEKPAERAPVPKTPAEEANDRAREEYFAQKNKKRPKGVELLAYWDKLEAKEGVYRAAKKKIVEGCLARGEAGRIEAQEFLLREVELKRKNDIENKFFLSPERMKKGISNGIETWDKWGVGQKDKDGNVIVEGSTLAKLTKMGISIVMIGAVSSFSVQKLAENGIGTASALAGGAGARLVQRLAVGLGIAAFMEKSSLGPKKKRALQMAMLAGTGVLVFSGTGMAGLGAIATSSVIGYAASRLTRRYEGKATERIKRVKEKGSISLSSNLDTLDEIEKRMEEVIRRNENKRLVGKIAEMATAITVSAGTLELMGAAQDYQEARGQDFVTGSREEAMAAQREADLGAAGADAKTPTETPPSTPAARGAIAPPAPGSTPPSTPDVAPQATPDATAPAPSPESGAPTPSTTGTFHAESYTFDQEKGGIQGILDLKAQMRQNYNNDFSHAPKSVQDFMAETNVTKQAIQLGFFNPNDPSGAESAMILKGSTLQFDDRGNLSFHDARGGDIILIRGEADSSGNIPAPGKYDGKMFDSDKIAPASETSTPEVSVPPPAPPATPEPTTTTPTVETPTSVEEVLIMLKENRPEAESWLINLGFTGDRNDLEAVRKFLDSKISAEGPVTPEILKARVLAQMGVETGENIAGEERVGENVLYGPYQKITDEIAGNPFHLKEDALREVDEVYTRNILKFFPDNNDWHSVSQAKASEILENGDVIARDSGGMHSAYDYLQKLQEITRLKPRGANIFHWRAENTEHYIARALQYAATKGGMLDQIENFETRR